MCPRLSDKELSTITDNFTERNCEVGCLIEFLWQVRRFRQDLGEVSSQSKFLQMSQEIEARVTKELLEKLGVKAIAC